MLKQISKKELIELIQNYEGGEYDTSFWDLAYFLPIPKDAMNKGYNIKEASLGILQGKLYNGITPKIIYCVRPSDYFEAVFDRDGYSDGQDLMKEVLDSLIMDDGIYLDREEFFDLFEEILIPDPFEIRNAMNKKVSNCSEEFVLLENYNNMFNNAQFYTPSTINFFDYVTLKPNLGDKISVKFDKKDNNNFNVVVDLPDGLKRSDKSIIISGISAFSKNEESFESDHFYENDGYIYVEIDREKYLDLIRIQHTKTLNLNVK